MRYVVKLYLVLWNEMTGYEQIILFLLSKRIVKTQMSV